MAKVIGLDKLTFRYRIYGINRKKTSGLCKASLVVMELLTLFYQICQILKIDAIGVMIQKKPRSLFKHLGNGNSWNFNQKAGGVSLLYNEKYANDPKHNHDINNLVENIHFLETSNARIML